MLHKAWSSIEEVPYCFARSSIKFHGHTGGKIDYLNPIWDYYAGRSYQILQICLVLHDVTCWHGFVYVGSVSGFPASSCDNCHYASWHTCYKVLRRSTRISAHLSSRVWRRSTRFWGRLSILVVASPNSSQICSMGLHSGDLAGCSVAMTMLCWKKIKDYPSTLRCGLIVLVAVVIPEMLPGKWN